MNAIVNFFQSSIGKKITMSLSGLFLCAFLVVHLSGNFLLFKNDGGVAFNSYAEFMSTNPVIRTFEIVLFAGFLIHIVSGVVVWLRNRRARPEKYEEYKIQENAKLASRITMLSGSIVFIFLVVHLRTFWVPSRITGESHNMYELVRTAFSSPYYDAFYLVALVLLGYHLRHGFQSAFQTLGMRNKPYIVLLDTLALIFWLLIPIGFATLPVYFLLLHYHYIGLQ